MKKYFSFGITGDDCWKVVLAWWFSALVTNGGFLILFWQFRAEMNNVAVIFKLGIIGVSLMALGFLAHYIFSIALLRVLMPHVGTPGGNISFNGNTGEYLKISFVGIVLSSITSNLYLPWLYRNQLCYLAVHTRLNEKEIYFLGKPGKLLVSILLVSLAATAILIVCLVLLYILGNFPKITIDAAHANGILASYSAGFSKSANISLQTFIMLILIIVLLTVFVSVLINLIVARWGMQFGDDESIMQWNGKLDEATLFYAGQLLLLLITLGIAWPFVMIHSWHYWISRMEIKHNGVTAFRFGFVKDFHYFKMFWTQAILCIVTVGIYLPWAFAKIAGRMVELCYVEEVVTESTNPAPIPKSQ